MPRWLALLLFPVNPMGAARRLQGVWAAVVVPVAVTVGAGAYLAACGVAIGDAASGSLALLRVLAGIAAGGLFASWIGARVIGRDASWRVLAGPVLAAAGWAPCVFLLFLLLARAGGVGDAAGVYAGIALLVWGVAAGFGIVGGDEDAEPGRLLVATCFGLGGVLIGLWLALAAPPAPPVLAVPSPVNEASIRAGDLLLVRARKTASEGDLVLLRQPASREAILARRLPDGTLAPIGEIQVDRKKLQDWNIAGRVFFRFGADGGGIVGPAEQTPKSSQD